MMRFVLFLALLLSPACDDDTGQQTQLDGSAKDTARVVDGGTDSGGGDSQSPVDAPASDGLRVPTCPGPIERCASTRCADGGVCLDCPAGQLCVEVNITCGPAAGVTAQCVQDPCAGSKLDCSCAKKVCESIQGTYALQCSVFDKDNFLVGQGNDPFMSCSGGGVCASPDTRIATPAGEVRIADLRRGDVVYSRHRGSVVAVPLIAVTRRRVRNHHVVSLGLDDGTALEISGPHPTADGRLLRDLAVGDVLDGRRVTSARLVPYAHRFTYDILPRSNSQSYLANGVWMGSTLAGCDLGGR